MVTRHARPTGTHFFHADRPESARLDLRPQPCAAHKSPGYLGTATHQFVNAGVDLITSHVKWRIHALDGKVPGRWVIVPGDRNTALGCAAMVSNYVDALFCSPCYQTGKACRADAGERLRRTPTHSHPVSPRLISLPKFLFLKTLLFLLILLRCQISLIGCESGIQLILSLSAKANLV